MRVHGSLLDVHGLGVLLVGPSGIGKTECALELVSRGHRLVADDVVELARGEDGRLVGTAPEQVRSYMEVRGLGIVSVPDLFGVEAVCERKAVDLVCRLQRWDEGVEYERVGLDNVEEEIGGARLPSYTLPARPGGSMATVVEVAAREHRLRSAGVSAAQRLDASVRDGMRRS